jgi:hypothetical protein
MASALCSTIKVPTAAAWEAAIIVPGLGVPGPEGRDPAAEREEGV